MKKSYFNIIFTDNKLIIPEIDDNELLQFSITFMDILKRDYKLAKNKKKQERS